MRTHLSKGKHFALVFVQGQEIANTPAHVRMGPAWFKKNYQGAGDCVSFPVKVDTAKRDWPANEGLGRNVSGGTRPRLSWGRSLL